MHMQVLHVNQHGQITLPAGIRKKYSISKGSALIVSEQKEGIVLKKVRVVSESAFEKISELAKTRGMSYREMLRLTREVGKEIEKH